MFLGNCLQNKYKMNSCFICLSTINSNVENDRELKTLINTACELLKFTNVGDLVKNSVCCSRCVNDLTTIQETFDNLKKTEEKLTKCLEHLKSIVVQSGDPKLTKTSQWSASCWRFRSQFQTYKQEPNWEIDPAPSSIPIDDQLLEQSTCLDISPPLLDDWEENFSDLEENSRRQSRKRRKIEVIAEEDDIQINTNQIVKTIQESESPNGQDPAASEADDRKRPNSQFFILPDNLFLYKQTIFVEYTHTHLVCRAVNCNFTFPFNYYPSFQAMRAHLEENHYNPKSDKAVTQCLLCRETTTKYSQRDFRKHVIAVHPQNRYARFGRVICEACLKPHNYYGHLSECELSHKNAEELTLAVAASASPIRMENSVVPRTDFVTPPRRKTGPKHDLPFLLIHPNLFLYKQSVFVEYTSTDLVCRCPQCYFKIPFDYYPSFQRMRDHIEENHRGHNFRRRKTVGLTCLLCDYKRGQLLSNKEFHKHLGTAHPEFSLAHSKCRGICECCLKPISYAAVFRHQFTHKNAEEVRLARELGLGRARDRVLKDSEKSDEYRTYKCTYEGCSYAAKTSSRVKLHMNTHLPPEARQDFKICEECGCKVRGNQHEMNRHVKRFHHKPDEIQNLLRCPHCEKKFLDVDRPLFHAHVKEHKGDKTFMCQDCGKSYTTKGQLNAHWKDAHQPGDWNCSHCGNKYANWMTLRKHLTKVHPGVAKTGLAKVTEIPEESTTSRFYTEVADRKKAKMLAPKRKWQCDQCDVVCVTRHVLDRHLMRIHQGKDVHARWKKVKNPRM